jgi:ATP-dependent DNA helicase Q1
MCDHCSRPPGPDSGTELDVSEVAEAARNFIVHSKNLDQRLTALKLVDALRGRGGTLLKKVDWSPPRGVASSKTLTETIVAHLLIENYLKEHFHFTPYNTISYMDVGDRKISHRIKIKVAEETESPSPKKRSAKSSSEDRKSKKKKKAETETESDEEVFCVSD